MNEDLIADIIDKELDNIDLSLDDMYDSNLENDISKLVHDQNEKVMKERMKKEIIHEIEEAGADVLFTENMNYDTLENILKDIK